MPSIVLTGGGTAGHVIPNIGLIPLLKQKNYQIFYIGSHYGIERDLIADTGVTYKAIASGKLRRYFSWQNFVDPFKVLLGFWQAFWHLFTIRPQVVFSKGGFVSVPVVFAAWLLRIPIVIHESDITSGLANRLCIPIANQVCVSFDSTLSGISKRVVTGSPVRPELAEGSREQGLRLAKFAKSQPTLLVIGGSLGSHNINNFIRNHLQLITTQYNVIHICGKGNLAEPQISQTYDGYYTQFEYVKDQLPHLLALSDIIISRAGSNAIFEWLFLRKPNILIPLGSKASRGDQLLNAEYFSKKGYSITLQEEELNWQQFSKCLQDINDNKLTFMQTMENSKAGNGLNEIIKVIERITHHSKH